MIFANDSQPMAVPMTSAIIARFNQGVSDNGVSAGDRPESEMPKKTAVKNGGFIELPKKRWMIMFARANAPTSPTHFQLDRCVTRAIVKSTKVPTNTLIAANMKLIGLQS